MISITLFIKNIVFKYFLTLHNRRVKIFFSYNIMEIFLIKYSTLPKKFIKDFFFIAKENYIETDIIIDFNLICEWLDVRKEHLKRILISNFEENYDYTETRLTKKTAKSNNYIEIKITPQCFKELCMISQTKKAKDVRKYFLEMEKLVKQYHLEIQEKMLKQLNKLKNNQKKDVEIIGGYVYVFESLEKNITVKKINNIIDIEETKLYKLGKSDDINKRFQVYNTGIPNKIIPILKIKVDDIHSVEICAKNALKKYQYRKNREIYDASPDFIRELILNCKEYLKGLQQRYEEYEKKCRKEISRIIKNNNKMFLAIVPIK